MASDLLAVLLDTRNKSFALNNTLRNDRKWTAEFEARQRERDLQEQMTRANWNKANQRGGGGLVNYVAGPSAYSGGHVGGDSGPTYAARGSSRESNPGYQGAYWDPNNMHAGNGAAQAAPSATPASSTQSGSFLSQILSSLFGGGSKKTA